MTPTPTPTLCNRCGGLDGRHGLIHVRHAEGGGGSNVRCAGPDTPDPGGVVRGGTLARRGGFYTAWCARCSPWSRLAIAVRTRSAALDALREHTRETHA